MSLDGINTHGAAATSIFSPGLAALLAILEGAKAECERQQRGQHGLAGKIALAELEEARWHETGHMEEESCQAMPAKTAKTLVELHAQQSMSYAASS